MRMRAHLHVEQLFDHVEYMVLVYLFSNHNKAKKNHINALLCEGIIYSLARKLRNAPMHPP